jgi:two-component system, chemotaxis family, chemotaxis protein CheY
MNFTGKILLVDDEAHIRKYVGLILKQLGTPVVSEAGNGQEAIVEFEKNKPDFVLLDVNMPHLDGIETLRKLKQLDPNCVVIMLTSLANRETVERALDLGAANYIRKDTPKEEIAKALEEIIEAFAKPSE